jgi:hypothetical protein
MTRRSVVMLFLGAATAATPSLAAAQTIGTFGWQTQPYCNVITVTVIQQGGLYQLTGSDNLCGAGTAPVTGTAVPAGGNVVFGVTAGLPSGRAAHLSATINLGTLSGTWSDADGNTGPFVFGATAAGAPRPAPAPSTAITVNQFAPSVYAGTGAAATVARSDHIHDDRYYTEGESDATTGTLVPRSALGPRGIVGQAEVFQSTATFRYSRASNGQTLTVTRPFLGTSLVVFPGFAGAPGATFDQTVHVTASSFNALCSAVSRTSGPGTQFLVQVNCINPSTLAPVDANFFITVTS